MVEIKNTTKKGMEIISDLNTNRYNGLYDAYNNPSRTKVRAYNEIENRARNTAGYNYDLHIVGASSHFFSTIYSYTDENGNKVIIKDTHVNTYKVTIPAA